MATEIQDTKQAAPPDLGPLRQILEKFQGEKGVLIPILQETQDAYGFLPPWALEEISAATGVPLAQIYGVATFYAQFRLAPIGEHLLRVCCGTACHVAGAEKITDSLSQTLGTEPGGTTADGQFTLETVACLGCCSLAPVIMIDDETYGRLDDKSVRKIIAAHKKSAQSH
jgi:NADH-quinone oxidoreductase subunit E